MSRWATGDWTLTPYQRRKLAIWRNSSDTPSAPKIALLLDEMQKKQKVVERLTADRRKEMGSSANVEKHTHTHTPGKW